MTENMENMVNVNNIKTREELESYPNVLTFSRRVLNDSYMASDLLNQIPLHSPWHSEEDSYKNYKVRIDSEEYRRATALLPNLFPYIFFCINDPDYLLSLDKIEIANSAVPCFNHENLIHNNKFFFHNDCIELYFQKQIDCPGFIDRSNNTRTTEDMGCVHRLSGEGHKILTHSEGQEYANSFDGVKNVKYLGQFIVYFNAQRVFTGIYEIFYETYLDLYFNSEKATYIEDKDATIRVGGGIVNNFEYLSDEIKKEYPIEYSSAVNTHHFLNTMDRLQAYLQDHGGREYMRQQELSENNDNESNHDLERLISKFLKWM